MSKYIPLDDVLQILEWECGDLKDTALLNKILSLPSVDPIGVLDEVLLEVQKNLDYRNGKDAIGRNFDCCEQNILQRAKYRILNQ